MFRILYNCMVCGMVFGVWVLGFFCPKLRRMYDGRRVWFRGGAGGGAGGGVRGGDVRGADVGTGAKNDSEKGRTFCIHCASLGEFEQGRTLIEGLRRQYPDVRLVLTFFSPSGYDVRGGYEGVDAVYYLPFDRVGDVRRFLDCEQPDKFFIVKYEYWYNLLRELNRRGCEVYLVSAIFRRSQHFFKSRWIGGGFYRGMLDYFTTIFVQDMESRALLAEVDKVEGVVVAGDTRFDRVLEITTTARDVPMVAEFVSGSDFTIVCGSTWPADDEHLLTLMHHNPEWRFVCVPHEISGEYIDSFIQRSGRSATKYSAGGVTEGSTLFVVDTIGVLSSVYQYGNVAYIGGGFGVGIHNTLEAATWGLPVVFGPNYKRFREARELVACGGGFSVGNDGELEAVMHNLLQNYRSAGSVAREYVHKNTGATALILESLSV